MKVKELGQYIQEQRKGARLTLRNLARAAGVSVPYLSQIERGLRRPSADILQAIAKGLRLSAETLYVKAGILDERKDSGLIDALMTDDTINERQRQTLIQIYESFRADTARERRRVSKRARGAELKSG